MLRHLVFAGVGFLGIVCPAAYARVWTSASGKFRVEAELVEERGDGTLVLRSPEGKLLKVKLEQLSPADRVFARQQLKQPAEKSRAEAPPPAGTAAATLRDDRSERLPIPDEAAQAKALDEIKKLLSEKSSKESAADLAAELLSLAKETTDNPTERYVLLLQAAETAGRIGEGPLIVAAIDELASHYTIEDAMERKVHYLESAVRSAGKNTAPTLPTFLLVSAEQAVTNDQFDLAKRLLDAAAGLARKRRDNELFKQVTARQREARDQQREYEKAADAIALLKKDPADIAANLAAGRYFALTKGDWAKGLPLLMKGGDPALNAIALLDLAEPSESSKQIEVADKWWTYAATAREPQQTPFRSRAAYWYAEALPTLSDEFSKTKAKSRIAEHYRGLSEQLASKQIAAKDPDALTLVGTWKVRLAAADIVQWDFGKNGRVRSVPSGKEGTWWLESSRVLVRWDEDPRQLWDTFYRPLNPLGTAGDSASSTLNVRARKAASQGYRQFVPAPDPRDARILVGQWEVRVSNNYVATWDFKANGSVTSNNNAPTGQWRLENDRVMIRWDRDPGAMWDTFIRPLNPDGIVGDNWTGELTLRGKKMH